MSAPVPSIDFLKFCFILKAPKRTSAGIFSQEGKLIKTLWIGKRFPTGTHYGRWDGTDLNNNLIDRNTIVKVKLVCHALSRSWEGIISNDDITYTRPISASIMNNKAYFCTDSRSGCNMFWSFDINGFVGQPKPLLFSDPFSSFGYVATDGTLTYWVRTGCGLYSFPDSFIVATSNKDNKMYCFPKGEDTTNEKWPSILGRVKKRNAITGIAVQKNGQYLLVSYQDKNIVKVFNKTSGELISEFLIQKPGPIAVGPSNEVYVSSDQILHKHIISEDGMISTKCTLSRFEEMSGISASFDGSMIAAINSKKDNQYIKTHTSYNQNILYILDGDKYNFSFDKQSCIEFEDSGNFWVGDSGNNRIIKIDSNSKNITKEINFPKEKKYSYCIDIFNVTRVFYGFNEYLVNYETDYNYHKLLGSWDIKFYSVASIEKKRYGLDSNGNLLQLMTNFILKELHIKFYEKSCFYPDKSIRYYKNNIQYKREFLGFLDDYPIWGDEKTIKQENTEYSFCYSNISNHFVAYDKYNTGEKWLHFTIDGLYLGRFINSLEELKIDNNINSELSSLNELPSPILIKLNNNRYYIYHASGGKLHRWRVRGLLDIKEKIGLGSLGDLIVLRQYI